MQRHDGQEYVPGIFANTPPHPSQVISLIRFSQENTTWNLPTMIAQTLLVSEIVRTYPAEFRMVSRLVQRKHPNMAEVFFIFIKYLCLIAVVLDILLTETFAARSDADCSGWAWTSSTLYFACSTLVFAVVSWRARIIFRTSKIASWGLGVGLSVQFAIAMWTNYRVDKADALTPAGTCAPSAQVHSTPSSSNPALHLHFWQSSTYWFLLYNTVFESLIMIACCWKLKKTSSGPNGVGLTRIAKVLFDNNVHYMAGVETCNLVECIMLMGWPTSLPPVHMTSIAIQIVMGLQMLIGEQEAVYSPVCSQMTFSAYSTSTSNGYVNKHHTASDGSSNVMYSSPGRTLSYVKRPGTANGATDGGFGGESGGVVGAGGKHGRKGTFSSISSIPAYVKSGSGATDEGVAPQVPAKGPIPFRRDVQVTVGVSPVHPSAGGAAPPPGPAPYM